MSLPIPLAARPSALLRPVPVAWAGARVETLLVGALVAFGLVVRWPHLFDSPPFPAVGQSILAAMAVAAGQAFPLADQAPYLGAPFIYLLGGAYRIFGASLEVTLVLTWVLGALAVVPTYWLGREVAGRLGGLVAGFLLATSPAHTVISSHVPWVHSLTPLVGTISLWLLVRAARRGDFRALLLAGLCMGLALQTHPTVLPLLAGAAGAGLWWGRAWFPLRRVAMFLGCVVLGYAPLLIHQARTQFEVVQDIQGKQARYLDADADPGERSDRGVYVNNLQQLSASLTRLVAGQLSDDEPTAGVYLRDPRLVVYPLLGLLGLVVGPRRCGWVLLAGLIPAILLPPLLNGKYKPVMDGRYLMPLVPVLFVGVGCLAARLRRLTARRAQPAAALLVACMVASLAGPALIRLDDYYEDTVEDGASNQAYFRTLAAIRSDWQSDEVILVDPRLREVKMPAGATVGSTFVWLLPLSGIQSQLLPGDASPRELQGQMAILQRDTASALQRAVSLTPLDGLGSPRKSDAPSFRPYRIGAAVEED